MSGKRRMIEFVKTIYYLNTEQLKYRIFNKLKFTLLGRRPISKINAESVHLKRIHLKLTYENNTVLNVEKNELYILNEIRKINSLRELDFNSMKFGELHAYKLNYFDFVNQKSKLSNDTIVDILNIWACSNFKKYREITYDAYPVSLRCINLLNWINCQEKNPDAIIVKAILVDHFDYLRSNLEKHLGGNHLLENYISLFYLSLQFDLPEYINYFGTKCCEELGSQILVDGAHFELSPHYHLLLMKRLLNIYDVLINNDFSYDVSSFREVILNNLCLMLGWLYLVKFNNGDIPMVSDSVLGEFPNANEVINNFDFFDIQKSRVKLEPCGYRTWKKNKLEVFMDIGEIGADSIPGHGHADTFNFILYFNDRPIIVDCGTSDYTVSKVRSYERSTKSHNTLCFKNENQSYLWDRFRVGSRVRVTLMEDTNYRIGAIHDGYEKYGIFHSRHFCMNHNFTIEDEHNADLNSMISRLTFAPDIVLKVVDDTTVQLDNFMLIHFFGYRSINIIDDYLANGYGKRVQTKVLLGVVEKLSKMEFEIIGL
jgi:uncharacterized heparinase superfamily protein